MRLVVRLLGGISLAVVLVTAGFAYLEVREHNIYRWAALLLSELDRMPQSVSIPRG